MGSLRVGHDRSDLAAAAAAAELWDSGLPLGLCFPVIMLFHHTYFLKW